MADLLEFLMEFLCQQDTIGKCQEFVSGYADPVQQVLFFLLFPTLFIIIFIGELTKIIRAIGKYRYVMSIAIFVYIVIQGWFHYFLLFGKFWFMSIIILGGLYVILTKMGVGGGGGGEKGKPRSLIPSTEDLAKLGKDLLIPGEVNPARRRELIKDIDHLKNQEKTLEQKAQALERQDPRAGEPYRHKLAEIDLAISEKERELWGGKKR